MPRGLSRRKPETLGALRTHAPSRPVGGRESSVVTETGIRRSLAATARAFAAQGIRKLLVTSSVPGEGKSSVVAEMGMGLAGSGLESVGLVDADPVAPT